MNFLLIKEFVWQQLCNVERLYFKTTKLNENFKITDKWTKFVLGFNYLCVTEDSLGLVCFMNSYT
jgi:hypothetical protein